MIDTSAVTILFTPRLSRAPLTRPQVKARYCRPKQALIASSSHTQDTKKAAGSPDICGVVPSGLDPDTVSLPTVDSVTETRCPGGRRCPETLTTHSQTFDKLFFFFLGRQLDKIYFKKKVAIVYLLHRSQTQYNTVHIFQFNKK